MITPPSIEQRACARIRGQEHARNGQASPEHHAAVRRAKAARAEALRDTIRHVVAALYPGARCVPATDLWLWRHLADETGATERELTTLAAGMGLWPHTPRGICDAVKAQNGEVTR